MLVGMKRADTWKPLGALTTRIAARLVARREAEIQGSVDRAPCEKKPSRGEGRLPAAGVHQGGDSGAGVLGKSGRPEGRIHGRPSAAGSNALIGGQMARAESEIHLVGTPLTPGRAIAAPLKLGRASIR